MATLKQLTRTIVASKVNPGFIFISISAGDGPDYEAYDPAVGRAQIRAFDTRRIPVGGVAFNRCVFCVSLLRTWCSRFWNHTREMADGASWCGLVPTERFWGTYHMSIVGQCSQLGDRYGLSNAVGVAEDQRGFVHAGGT
jgi:hypothetical protein